MKAISNRLARQLLTRNISRCIGAETAEGVMESNSPIVDNVS